MKKSSPWDLYSAEERAAETRGLAGIAEGREGIVGGVEVTHLGELRTVSIEE